MIKCIVIDDQTDSIELLADHIQKRKDLKLIQSFTNPLEALSFLESNQVDLVFIDIRMPHINGLEFIESLRAKYGNNVPSFMLITGSDEYALPGFEQGAIDYLLKPIGEKRFRIALDRFFNRNQKNKGVSEKGEYFFAEINGNKKQKINFKDISFIESAGNYVAIFGDNDLKEVIYKSMNAMQEIVPADNFIRVHKSYIVSVNHIHAIKGNGLIMNRNGTTMNVPIGVTYKNITLKKLNLKND